MYSKIKYCNLHLNLHKLKFSETVPIFNTKSFCTHASLEYTMMGYHHEIDEVKDQVNNSNTLISIFIYTKVDQEGVKNVGATRDMWMHYKIDKRRKIIMWD